MGADRRGVPRTGPERAVSFRRLVEFPSTTHGAFGLYRYPAKFIPHVVAYALREYAPAGGTVFDPFAGCGTVGTVSRLYGHDYELWDLNPIIEVLHDITLLEPSAMHMDTIVDEMQASSAEFLPDWDNFHYWFAQEFAPVLSRAWGYYHMLDDRTTKLMLTVPLLKVSRYFSFDDMGRMKLSKSPRSVQRVGRLLSTDWETEFYNMLRSEAALVEKRLREYWGLGPRKTRHTVRGGVDSLGEALTRNTLCS